MKQACAGRQWGKSGIWLAFFAIATLLATTGFVHIINVWVEQKLLPIGIHFPWLELVWIIGSTTVTLLTVVATGLIREESLLLRIVPVLLWGAGNLIEVLSKHWLYALPPFPTGLSPQAGSWLEKIETLLAPPIPFWPASASLNGGSFLIGSFPSGHVFRTTFMAGLLLPQRLGRVLVPVIGAATAFATIATGGHWLWDGIGGFCLAQAALSAWQAAQNIGRT
ncbi:MAG: phosphatase PAP2 family protein [Firmicutes bacterium]|nr:phosphatase PAP2 family protein [Bacillota bacterium]